MNAFEQAAAEKNFTEVAALAHWLKGTGGTIGFDVFNEPAINLEKFAKQEQEAEVNQSIRELRALAKRLHIPSPGSPDPLGPKPNAGPVSVPRELPADQEPVISKLASNDKFKHIVEKFVIRLKEQENLMDRALEQDNLEEFASLALWLKGEAGTVGYVDFTEPANELFKLAKSGAAEQVRPKYDQIKRMIQAVVPPAFN